MADDEKPWFSPDHKPKGIPRQRRVGVEVWRLSLGNRIQTCEISDDREQAAGFDVALLEGGELFLSLRCTTIEEARFVANAFRRDQMQVSGWTVAPQE
jgi:hypothetical protein